MSILNVDKIQPIGGGSTITVDATDIQATSATITASSFVGSITGTASNASGATGDFSIVDKIIHTGDTNTSIRFPAVDTFSVETSGTERFRIASDGKIYAGGTTASDTAGEVWFNDTSAYSSAIKQVAGSSALTFHTGQSQPERLRITNAGKVGINSTTQQIY